MLLFPFHLAQIVVYILLYLHIICVVSCVASSFHFYNIRRNWSRFINNVSQVSDYQTQTHTHTHAVRRFHPVWQPPLRYGVVYVWHRWQCATLQMKCRLSTLNMIIMKRMGIETKKKKKWVLNAIGVELIVGMFSLCAVLCQYTIIELLCVYYNREHIVRQSTCVDIIVHTVQLTAAQSAKSRNKTTKPTPLRWQYQHQQLELCGMRQLVLSFGRTETKTTSGHNTHTHTQSFCVAFKTKHTTFWMRGEVRTLAHARAPACVCECKGNERQNNKKAIRLRWSRNKIDFNRSN